MQVFRFWLTAMLLLLTSISYGQITPEVLELKVDSIMADKSAPDGPGSTVLVIEDGQIVLNKGYGLASLEHNVPNSGQTIFDLASLSKQFTGYAISVLIEEGRINVGDNIRDYIPEFPEFEKEVTIGHLVHHTSGLRDWTHTLLVAGWSFEDVISFDQILRMVYAQNTSNFPSGEQYAYSNSGYNVLAELIQRVTDTPFSKWMHEHVFDPLNMQHTFFLDDHTKVIPNRAYGYYQDDEDVFHVDPNLLTALGSSSMYSTSSDLALWAMHLSSAYADEDPVVMRMFTRGVLNDGSEVSYAYGIGVGTYRGQRRLSHSGSWASFTSYIGLYPESDLSIVVLSNRPNSPWNTTSQIASLYIAAQPSDSKPESEEMALADVPTSVLKSYTGTYKLGTAWYVDITYRNKQLWTQATNEDNFPMTANSDSAFTIEAYGGRTMTFFKDQEDEVTHLVYNGNDCPKMTVPSTFSSAAMHNYIGEYYSSELNTSYYVRQVEDELQLWHFRHGELELNPVWNDDFTSSRWFVSPVKFTRNADGQIDGLEFSGFRARNMKFEKVSN